jgi:Tfp pilus assembly protein PilF
MALAFQKHDAGDYAGAASIFLQAATQFPAARSFAARSIMEEGQLQEAYDQATQAVSQAGSIPVTHFMLGLVAERAGRPDEAAQEYQRVLDLDPQAAAAYNNLGGLAYLKEDFYTARVQTERALNYFHDAHSKSISLANLAELDELDNHLDTAEERLNQALDAAPEDAPAYYSLAALYDVTSRMPAALMMEKNALGIDVHGAVWRSTSFVWPELELHAQALAEEAAGQTQAATEHWTALNQIDTAGALHWSALKGVAAAHLARLSAPAAEMAPQRALPEAAPALAPTTTARPEVQRSPTEEPAIQIETSDEAVRSE